eukprot:c9834_g1_i9.p1 GENE.c9834_g1_i9~~c9834_g1_i9.p1  ORF type:complete len:270 (+),score=63.32 c9834_g1_i9:683-1492(+)
MFGLVTCSRTQPRSLGIEFYVGLPAELEPRVCPLLSLSMAQRMKVIFSQLYCTCLAKSVHPSHHLDTAESRFVKTLISGMKKGKRLPKTDDTYIMVATVSCLDVLLKPTVPNSRLYHEVEIPSANGVTNARAIAKIANVLANRGRADGVQLLSESAFERAHEHSPHPVFDEAVRRDIHLCNGGWGKGTCDGSGLFGITIPDDNRFLDRFPELDKDSTGWCGAGGSLFQWNAEKNYAIGYVMNTMGMQLVVDRPILIRNALMHCIRALEQ